MGAYIKGIGSVSPQRTVDKEIFAEGIMPFSGNRFNCQEPDYSRFIDARQIRRMSRVIRMSITASMLAMKEASMTATDAVIVGTALGCLEDTEAFLKKLVQNNEDMLSPTSFIYSTHNTLAAQVGLMFGCKGYNSTYVHRNISFESALVDALMLLHEGSVGTVLAGGVDELTNSSFAILERLGSYKSNEELQDGSLYTHRSKGSLAGEGASFMALSNTKEGSCYAELLDVKSVSFSTPMEASAKARAMLDAQGFSQPDLLISGYNGDVQDDAVFDSVAADLHMHDNVMRYKHLCGEYGTSSAFAVWMAAEILKQKAVPDVFQPAAAIKGPVHSILIHNQYQGLHHSFILLSAC